MTVTVTPHAPQPGLQFALTDCPVQPITNFQGAGVVVAVAFLHLIEVHPFLEQCRQDVPASMQLSQKTQKKHPGMNHSHSRSEQSPM